MNSVWRGLGPQPWGHRPEKYCCLCQLLKYPQGTESWPYSNHRGHSPRQHIFTRDAFKTIMHPPPSTVRANTEDDALKAIDTNSRNDTANIFPHDHCQDQHIPQEALSQQYTSTGNIVTVNPSSRLYFIRAVHTKQVSQEPDTNRRLCCNHPYHTAACTTHRRHTCR